MKEVSTPLDRLENEIRLSCLALSPVCPAAEKCSAFRFGTAGMRYPAKCIIAFFGHDTAIYGMRLWRLW